MSEQKPKSRPYWIWAFNALLFGFIVWGFLHVPRYRIPTWPDNWAPTGEKWEAEWTEIGGEVSKEPIVHISVMPQLRSLLFTVWGKDKQLGYEGVRYDLDARKVVARGAPWAAEILTAGDYRYQTKGEPFTVGGLAFDPDTLATEEKTFWLRPPITEEFTILGIAELPDGHISMLLWEGEYSDRGELHWVRFDAAGQEVARRNIDSGFPRECAARPESAPTAFVSRVSLKFGEGVTGIDIRTGADVVAPKSERPYPERITWRFAALTTRRGYSPMMFHRDYEATDCALELHYGVPSVLASFSPVSLDKRERAVQSLARFRRSVWDLLYSDEFLRERELEARTLDQVYLRVADDDLSPWVPVQGDLAMTVRVASQRDRGPRVSEATNAPYPFPEETPTVAEYQAQVQLKAHLGPEQSVIVSQFLTDLPSHLELPNGLLRIGLIPKGNDTVQWLGWLPMKSTLPIPTTEYRQLHLSRIGDELLLMSAFLGNDQENPAIWYTFIPCPNALMALPEGELR